MSHPEREPNGAVAESPQKTGPGLKRRSVVSSFIFKLEGTPDEQPQVALFRRSQKVSTYRDHLAPISGSIESSDASPLAAAWREIAEETTLDPSSLTFLRHGKSYTFSDPSVGREWTIYPFAFALMAPTAESESRITIDWEHTSWSWHAPASVTADDLSFPGVPRLAESLRRVWFENDLGPTAGAILSKALDTLATDHVSGARQMASHALCALRETIVAFTPCAPTEEWWSTIRMTAWHLIHNGRESMSAAIQSALLAALVEIEKRMATHPADADAFLPAVTKCIDDVLAQRTSSATHLSSSLSDFLTSAFPPSQHHTLTILTLSESSTITTSLVHLAQTGAFPNLAIHILESRPLFEGVSLAASLASTLSTAPSSVRITLHTDASAALASSNVNLILLGADRIASSGAVSNKTGSLPAVLSARYVMPGAKVVVLSDTEKIASPGSPSSHVVEDNGAEQVAAAWSTSNRLRDAATALQSKNCKVAVQVRNVFFEWVPAELVDVYITERGKWAVDDIARHAEGVKAEEERMFGGL
ncbi:hypothetical protein QBC39DRAFT_327363 [Podospora conica]|nr:hypothetical protein QBC39DRAFT_327363 [Schizothecium conicum]